MAKWDESFDKRSPMQRIEDGLFSLRIPPQHPDYDAIVAALPRREHRAPLFWDRDTMRCYESWSGFRRGMNVAPDNGRVVHDLETEEPLYVIDNGDWEAPPCEPFGSVLHNVDVERAMIEEAADGATDA